MGPRVLEPRKAVGVGRDARPHLPADGLVHRLLALRQLAAPLGVRAHGGLQLLHLRLGELELLLHHLAEALLDLAAEHLRPHRVHRAGLHHRTPHPRLHRGRVGPRRGRLLGARGRQRRREPSHDEQDADDLPHVFSTGSFRALSRLTSSCSLRSYTVTDVVTAPARPAARASSTAVSIESSSPAENSSACTVTGSAAASGREAKRSTVTAVAAIRTSAAAARTSVSRHTGPHEGSRSRSRSRFRTRPATSSASTFDAARAARA